MTTSPLFVTLGVELDATENGVRLCLIREIPDADHLVAFLSEFGRRTVELAEPLLASPGPAPAENSCTSSPADPTDDVLYAEKQSARNGAASAPAKAVPAAKVAAPKATGAVCSDCGAVLQMSEEKTSKLFCGKPLCAKCLQASFNGPQPGEVGPV